MSDRQVYGDVIQNDGSSSQLSSQSELGDSGTSNQAVGAMAFLIRISFLIQKLTYSAYSPYTFFPQGQWSVLASMRTTVRSKFIY